MLYLHRQKTNTFINVPTPFSSRAASGLLMLLTNLLTCSKCFVISVASTISMMACRSVRYSFLGTETNGDSWTTSEKSYAWEKKTEREMTALQIARGLEWTVFPSWLRWQWRWIDALFTLPLWADQHARDILLLESNRITTQSGLLSLTDFSYTCDTWWCHKLFLDRVHKISILTISQIDTKIFDDLIKKVNKDIKNLIPNAI